MAKLNTFTSLKNDDLENGENLYFTNPSYDFDDTENTKHGVVFKPPKKRCTRFNFAVAVFILASGGLAVFLIVKFEQDNYDADPTQRPRVGEMSTKTTTSSPVSTTGMADTGLVFDVTMRLSNQIWTDDFQDTNSEAYKNLSNSLTQQIKKGLSETELGSNLNEVFITGIRNGSVIIDVLIQLKAPSSASSLLSSLRNATERAKSSGLLPLLADVDTESIKISLTPTSSQTTTMKKDTTTSNIQSSTTRILSSTLSSTTKSMITTKTMITTTLPSKNETTIISTTPVMSTQSSTPAMYACNDSDYLTYTLLNQCLNTSQLSEVSQSTKDVKCNFVLASIDCVLDQIQKQYNITCTEGDKRNAAKEFSSVVQSNLGINPEICIIPSTSLSPPTIMTTTVKMISPCNNSEYLTFTLINQCLNTSQLAMVSQSSDDIKCNFVLASIDCVLDQIQKEYNITCTEADKRTAAKEFSSVVQSNLGINPEICIITSTSLPPPTMMTTTIKILSPCNNSEYLTTTLINQCLNTSQLAMVSQSSDDVKCNFVLSSIDCVLDQIQMEYNVTCSEADKRAAAKEFSGIVQEYLRINPEICITTSTSFSPTTMTTTTSMMETISPCNNSRYLTNTLVNNCLNTTQLDEVSQSSVDVKCNFVISSIDCVLHQIKMEYNVTCSEGDKRAAAKEFSDIVQSYLRINPEICITSSTSLLPTTTTSMMEIISPCNNSDYLTNTLLNHCLNTTQLNEVSQSSDNVKCNFVIASIDCVLDQIQMEYNITCSEADKGAAAKEFSDIVQSYLRINPEICIASSTSLSPTTMTTTIIKIISPCSNTDYLTNTLVNHCFNNTQLNQVTQSSDDVKCNFVIASIDCVLHQIQMEYNITCSEADKRAAAKEFSGIVQEYLRINPEICISTSLGTTTSTHMANMTTISASTVKPSLPPVTSLSPTITTTMLSPTTTTARRSSTTTTVTTLSPKTTITTTQLPTTTKTTTSLATMTTATQSPTVMQTMSPPTTMSSPITLTTTSSPTTTTPATKTITTLSPTMTTTTQSLTTMTAKMLSPTTTTTSSSTKTLTTSLPTEMTTTTTA